MPKSHKIVFTTNPVEGQDLIDEILEQAQQQIPGGTVTEISVDMKRYAYVTVESEDPVSLESLLGLASEKVKPHRIGPVNLEKIYP